MDVLITIFHVLMLGFLTGLVRTEVCTDWDEDDGFITCASCCGSWPYERCCETWLVGAIIGGVIGGILLIALIFCIICVCVKQKGKTGRIIQPAGVVQPPIYTTTVAYAGPYPQYGMVQPPPYQAPPEYPPSNQNLYGHPAPTAPPPVPEGLQSHPPASSGLPGNHKVV